MPNPVKEILKIALGSIAALLALYYLVDPSVRVVIKMQGALDRSDSAEARRVPAKARIDDYRYDVRRSSIHAGTTFDYRQTWNYSISYRRSDGTEARDSVTYVTHQRGGPETPALAKGPVRGDSVDIYYDPQGEAASELAAKHNADVAGQPSSRAFFNGMFIFIALIGLAIAIGGWLLATHGFRRLRRIV